MQSLSNMKTHDPAKAEVLGFFFDAINELEHDQGWSEKTKEVLREKVNEIMIGRLYSGTPNLSHDDLKHFYEKDFWQVVQHMTIKDYAADATKLYEFEAIESRYYQELARAVYEAKAEEVLTEIGKQLEEFYDYLNGLDEKEFWGASDYRDTFEAGHIELLALSSECPHGWQVHTDEQHEGDLYVYRWLEGQVEELNAISLSMFGGALWATLTIDPKDGRGRIWEARQ